MKSSFVLSMVALSLSSSISLAQIAECKKYEAQLFATVTAITSTLKDDGTKTCSFKLKVGDWFSEHGTCPLTREAAETMDIEDTGCVLILGDKVSGILVHVPQSGRTYFDLQSLKPGKK